MGYHLTLLSTASVIIENSVGEDVNNFELLHVIGRIVKNISTTMENRMKFPQKFKRDLTYDLTILLLDRYLKSVYSSCQGCI
jgi:hypothetical protein